MADPLADPNWAPTAPGAAVARNRNRTQATERYGRAIARSDYNLGQYDIQRDRAIRDIQRAYGRNEYDWGLQNAEVARGDQRRWQPMAARGMLRSGAFDLQGQEVARQQAALSEALRRMQEDRDVGLGNVQYQHGLQVGQEGLTRDDYSLQYNQALEQADMDAYAAELAYQANLQNQPGYQDPSLHPEVINTWDDNYLNSWLGQASGGRFDLSWFQSPEAARQFATQYVGMEGPQAAALADWIAGRGPYLRQL